MNRKYFLFSTCFIVSALTAPRSGGQPRTEDIVNKPSYRADELKLAVLANKNVYSVDDPIRLDFTIKNLSQQERSIIQYGTPHCSYWLRLMNEEGKDVGIQRFISQTGNINLPITWQKKLRPSETMTEAITLSSVIKVPGRGRYRLRAWRFPFAGYRLNFEMAVRAGKPVNLKGGIESNEIRFEIQ